MKKIIILVVAILGLTATSLAFAASSSAGTNVGLGVSMIIKVVKDDDGNDVCNVSDPKYQNTVVKLGDTCIAL
jgi:hypothetical protein